MLESYDNVLFGPFVGEAGWEIFRWSGYVRKFKSDHPDKNVVVCSKPDMYDLYNGYVDGFEPLYISNERPDCYLARGLSNYNEIVDDLKKKYPNHYMFEPVQLGLNKNTFDVRKMNYDISPSIENGEIINSLLKNTSKVPIVVAPRNRADETKRNWGKIRWNSLYSKLYNSNRFFVFIAGKTPQYVRPTSGLNFCVLEDQLTENSSLIGLSIEAIKHSKITVGSQSSIPQLSLLLKTPVISWGNQKRRHSIDENIMNTQCIFYEDLKYEISPETIFNEIINRTAL